MGNTVLFCVYVLRAKNLLCKNYFVVEKRLLLGRLGLPHQPDTFQNLYVYLRVNFVCKCNMFPTYKGGECKVYISK